MSIKFFFDGVGTGSGVAWSLFGIVASAVSLSIGGVITITLGSFCCLLFLGITAASLYISYKKIEKEDAILEKKLDLNAFTFIENFYECYLHSKPTDKYTFTTYLAHWETQQNANTLQVRLVKFLRETEEKSLLCYSSLSKAEKKQFVARSIKNFIYINDLTEYISIPPKKELSSVAFLSFVGVFGSIAGCSAGIMGVIAALGLLTGFGAIPILGAVILLLGAGFGAYAAFQSVQGAIEKNKKTQFYKNFKQFNHNFERNLLPHPMKYIQLPQSKDPSTSLIPSPRLVKWPAKLTVVSLFSRPLEKKTDMLEANASQRQQISFT